MQKMDPNEMASERAAWQAGRDLVRVHSLRRTTPRTSLPQRIRSESKKQSSAIKPHSGRCCATSSDRTASQLSKMAPTAGCVGPQWACLPGGRLLKGGLGRGANGSSLLELNEKGGGRTQEPAQSWLQRPESRCETTITKPLQTERQIYAYQKHENHRHPTL